MCSLWLALISDPNARPTFSQLVTILEDAKPEQVQAVQSFFCQKSGGGVSDRNSTMLEFEGKNTGSMFEIAKDNFTYFMDFPFCQA
jgi:hypothetical protein